MAILTVREFNTSRFAQMADSTEASVPMAIARAEAAIKRQLQRPVEPEAFEEVYHPTGNRIYLRNRPVLEINRISVGHAFLSSYDSTMYSLDKKTGVLTFLRSLGGRNVTVEYTAGFDPVPEDLKEAVIMQTVLFLYTDLEVYGAGDGKEPGILYFERDIEKLLKPYKQLHMAYT